MQEIMLLLCGGAIKKLRTDRQLEQDYVSNALQLNRADLDLIENGKQFPDPGILLNLCCLYDISIAAFWRNIELEVVKQQPAGMLGKAA